MYAHMCAHFTIRIHFPKKNIRIHVYTLPFYEHLQMIGHEVSGIKHEVTRSVLHGHGVTRSALPPIKKVITSQNTNYKNVDSHVKSRI